MLENHVEAGHRGEAVALDFFMGHGYRLLQKNFRFQRGEIDLILESPDGEWVFVEVKSNRGSQAGDPLGWVTPRKQRQIQRVAQSFCVLHGNPERAMRFDAVAVDLESKENPVRHIPNAFLPAAAAYFR